jgi:SAM-dependent methyltransferase
MDALNDLLPRLFADPGTVRSAILTGRRDRTAVVGEETFQRVNITPIDLKGGPVFQFEYRFPKKVTHRNVAPAQAADEAAALLSETFSQAVLRTADETFHVTLAKNGGWSVKRNAAEVAAASEAPAAHNRAKNYVLPEGRPIPFLVRLGVMTAEGRVVAARQDKFRQINRFLEMVADTLPALPADRTVRVVDFGSGKSYLTFALYHFLRIEKGLDVEIVGLDIKRDVIAGCARIAHQLGWADRLRFEVGDIAGFGDESSRADLVVSLHACDTATDDAIAKAIGWGASVILAVPCCQHEIYAKLPSRDVENPVRPLLKHGIFRERLAALITDALRAEALEREGYGVQVLEFIPLEHTPKNLLIRAIRRAKPEHGRQERAGREYDTFRDFWHVAPYLDTVLPYAPAPDDAAPPT